MERETAGIAGETKMAQPFWGGICEIRHILHSCLSVIPREHCLVAQVTCGKTVLILL